ncbi:hypothetical protein [Candidatus Chlorohelix sp.]|uniref:hypothetical protein n=1 Tax=Candidatus Chlorohelix sp. TaxID=3139201 RepID=UPI003144EDCE
MSLKKPITPTYVNTANDEDIWDIGAIAAFYALSNRMAHLSNMRPNDEFYLVGRLPKNKNQ